MDKTTIISTWIEGPQWADGWQFLHGPNHVPTPSVWLIDPARTHLLLANQYSNTLSYDELTRADRFHHAAHGIRYKVTHTALRMLLARATNAVAEKLQFVCGHHNKPVLSTYREHPTRFNLSYTENRAMIGIGDGSEIGIDIEWLNRPMAIDDMLSACFSATEIEYITSQQENVRHRFFTLWTRKEAILKLTAEGIGEHLPLFEVLDGSCEAEKEIIGGNPPDRIYLYSFRIGNDYLGCYAAPKPLDRLSGFQL